MQPITFSSPNPLRKNTVQNKSAQSPIYFGRPQPQASKQAAKSSFPFSNKELVLGALYLLGSFAGISKVLTGSLPLRDITPNAMDGHSGWPANTTVLAAGGQDVVHQISNKWFGKKQRYIDHFVDDMRQPGIQSIPEAHARLSESGFQNFYFQNIHPTASSDLTFELKDGKLQPSQCADTFKKADDPRTQHIILIAGKDASTYKMEQMLKQQFPLIPPEQITVLKNPTRQQLKQSLAMTNQAMSQQLQDSALKKNPPQLLLYYQGHGGIFTNAGKSAPEGSHKGGILLGDGPVDENWFVTEMQQFPADAHKTLLFESCYAGSFIKV